MMMKSRNRNKSCIETSLRSTFYLVNLSVTETRVVLKQMRSVEPQLCLDAVTETRVVLKLDWKICSFYHNIIRNRNKSCIET